MAAAVSSLGIVIAGLLDDPSYHKAAALVSALCDEYKTNEAHNEEIAYQLIPMLEPEWDRFIIEQKQILGGNAFSHKASHLITIDGAYLGDCGSFETFCQEKFTPLPKLSLLYFVCFTHRILRIPVRCLSFLSCFDTTMFLFLGPLTSWQPCRSLRTSKRPEESNTCKNSPSQGTRIAPWI